MRMPRGVYERTPDMKTGKHMKGRKLPKSTRVKMSASSIGRRKPKGFAEKLRRANLGKKHSEETKKKIGAAAKGRRLTEEQILARSGENNPNWRGGVTKEYKRLINSRYWRDLREKVIGHYGNFCFYCEEPLEKWYMHHRIPRRVSEDDTLLNLVPCCAGCHMFADAQYRSYERRKKEKTQVA